MIDELQKFKSKTKLKFNQKINDFFDEMNYGRQSGYLQLEEDAFSKDAQRTA